ILFLFFFFFSSRRRHTRSDRDWSSDVCSSDLFWLGGLWVWRAVDRSMARLALQAISEEEEAAASIGIHVTRAKLRITLISALMRSEERRVGKECRCGWAGGHQKKKKKGSGGDR